MEHRCRHWFPHVPSLVFAYYSLYGLLNEIRIEPTHVNVLLYRSVVTLILPQQRGSFALTAVLYIPPAGHMAKKHTLSTTWTWRIDFTWPNEQLSPSKWLIMYYGTFWLIVWTCRVIDCSITPVYGLGVSRPESVYIPAECADFRDQFYNKTRAIYNLLIWQWTYDICMKHYASWSHIKHPKQAWPCDLVPELLWHTLKRRVQPDGTALWRKPAERLE